MEKKGKNRCNDMVFIQNYDSPMGRILIAADEKGICGLWFYDQKYFAKDLESQREEKQTDVLLEAKCWLDLYFSGKKPDFLPSLHPVGTAFQQEVWKILSSIPYGKTMTYQEISQILAKRRGMEKMAAQAVGRAISHNKISLLIPCHRVIGKNKSLIGYAGGLEKKRKLLELEGIDFNTFSKKKKDVSFSIHFAKE